MSDPDYRQLLINLCAGLSLADHMGDVLEDCERALKRAGIEVPDLDGPYDGPWPNLAHFLATEHGARTIFGTPLLDKDDEE